MVNSRLIGAVSRAFASWRILLLLPLMFAAHGCVQIEGGAAELSWSLRNSSGKTLSCAEVDITHLRLCWYLLQGEDSGCPNFQEFPCDKSTGVTAFDITPGETALFIEPVFGNAACSYAVPAPIVRDVEEGRVVTLNSLLVVINTTTCGSS